MKKYEFTGETKQVLGLTLHQIKAIRDFGNVKAGDIGGWIEKEENLSHDGNAWVYENARVYGDAWVYGNAEVCGNAEVYGNARVYGNAWVYGNAMVYGNAEVYGNAMVYGNAWVYRNAWVCGDARVCGDASINKADHIMWTSNIGSRNDTVTFMRSKESKIIVSVGCFRGTIDEFEKAVEETHGENEHAQVYKLAIQMAKVKIKC